MRMIRGLPGWENPGVRDGSRRGNGFTREYGGGCDGERLMGIGQQGRPFRGLTRSYTTACAQSSMCVHHQSA
ncbi:hypothetical protein DZA28_10025 [Pseudomonas alloputida]|uniref:Uncharacterized protein n=1 Tax=Pseudomonas alloputida TaxID=1940621 RepID=A0ABY3D3Y4_9PSED|nr:hypothetical protein DZA28_10025 [Pseudomonas alloputida]